MALEYRAKERKFDTYFLGKKNAPQQTPENNKTIFPFRSPIVDIKKPPNHIRIWMASASYAEDSKRKIDELFPNILCDKVGKTKQTCQMLNAAKAGLTINDNIKQIKNSAKKWNPDYVLLYSMNLDINELSQQFFSLRPSKNIKKEDDNIVTETLSFGEAVEKMLEQMTVYNHLRRYIGGEVLLSTLLHNDIDKRASNAFKKRLIEFIQACNTIGAKPILVTFATQYSINTYENMVHDDKLSLVRYNEYLSDKGWVKTVHDFNNIIRKTAIENNIPYIDLEKEISGKKNLFTDFVHFTKNGHKIIGNHLAEKFTQIVQTRIN